MLCKSDKPSIIIIIIWVKHVGFVNVAGQRRFKDLILETALQIFMLIWELIVFRNRDTVSR